MSSSDPSRLLVEIMDSVEAVPADGIARKKETVSGKFRRQLRALLDEMHRTESHFVRCIKPNPEAKPRLADNAYVGSQLECAGVLQTIAMKRQGYPVRKPISEFFARYRLIAPIKKKKDYFKSGANALELSKQLLQWYALGFKWKHPHSDIGHTKVFLKTFVYDSMERVRQLVARRMVRKVVPYLKKWIARYRKRKEEEERRRQEELRRLQQQKRSSPEEAARIAQGAGLPPEKSEGFTKAAALFPSFDLPVILDVVYNLPTLEKAIQALMSMQQTRVEGTLSGGLKIIYQELQLAPDQQERLTVGGITTQEHLFNLTEGKMRELGFNDQQCALLLGKILAQRSRRVVSDKLATLYGTVNVDDIVKEVAKTRQTLPEGQCPVCGALVEMGRLPEHVDGHYSAGGDRAASTATINPPPSRTPQVGRPQHSLSSSSSSQNPPNSNVLYHSSNSGSTMRMGQPPLVHPPPTSSSSASQPAAPSTSNSTGDDVAKVRRLMELGFSVEAATVALRANNGDVHRAASYLLGSS
eukprot:PhM_4_TR16453/c0_g1_i1/m.14410